MIMGVASAPHKGFGEGQAKGWPRGSEKQDESLYTIDDCVRSQNWHGERARYLRSVLATTLNAFVAFGQPA